MPNFCKIKVRNSKWSIQSAQNVVSIRFEVHLNKTLGIKFQVISIKGKNSKWIQSAISTPHFELGNMHLTWRFYHIPKITLWIRMTLVTTSTLNLKQSVTHFEIMKNTSWLTLNNTLYINWSKFHIEVNLIEHCTFKIHLTKLSSDFQFHPNKGHQVTCQVHGLTFTLY